METHAAEISETLQKYGSCVLPGIGRLELVQRSAERSFPDSKLLPPSFHIILTIAPPDSGPSVTDQIAGKKNITPLEAEKEWQNTLQTIREKLSTGSSVPLEGLGWLNLNEKGEIAFVSSLPTSLLYASVPLKPQHEPGRAETEPRQHAAEAAPFNTQADDPEANLSRLKTRAGPRWWITGSILILIAIGWFTYKGTKTREKKKVTVKEILNQPPKDEGVKLDSMKQSIDSMRKVRNLSNDSIRYKIIIASYENKDQAENQYKKLRGWGHPVELLQKNSVYELAWPFTSLPIDTTVNLLKMTNLYGKKVRIEYNNP